MKKYMMLHLAGLAVAGTLASPAVAGSYTASSWLPGTYELSSQGFVDTFDRVRENSGGELDFEVHLSGSLLPAKTTMTGVRDGVAQVGIVYPPYTPAELPFNNLLNSASFLSEDPMVAALAYTEMNFTNETLLAEWGRYGVVFGGGYSTPVYNLLCNNKIAAVGDMQGKRLRTASSTHSAIVSALEGSPVSAPIGDVYSGMQRGSLDCAVADPTNLVSASFNEVVTDVTDVPLGVVIGAIWVYNDDFWHDVTADDRRLLLDEMALGIIRTQNLYRNNALSALEDAKGRGINIVEPEDDLTGFVKTYKADFIAGLSSTALEGSDAATSKALIDAYIATQARWADLLKGIDRNDETALLAVIKENLYDKVDVSK